MLLGSRHARPGCLSSSRLSSSGQQQQHVARQCCCRAKRGRPRKTDLSDAETAQFEDEFQQPVAAASPAPKGRRGRPRKTDVQADEPLSTSQAPLVSISSISSGVSINLSMLLGMICTCAVVIKHTACKLQMRHCQHHRVVLRCHSVPSVQCNKQQLGWHTTADTDAHTFKLHRITFSIGHACHCWLMLRHCTSPTSAKPAQVSAAEATLAAVHHYVKQCATAALLLAGLHAVLQDAMCAAH
jgi:hypothetical protein